MSRYYNSMDMDTGDDLEHFGVKGMKWGIRRYQNTDGSLTTEGKKKYHTSDVQTALANHRANVGSGVGAVVGGLSGGSTGHVLGGNKGAVLGSMAGAITGMYAGAHIGENSAYSKNQRKAARAFGGRNGTNNKMLNRELELSSSRGSSSIKKNRQIGERLLNEFGEDNFRRYIGNKYGSHQFSYYARYGKGTVDDILNKYSTDRTQFNRIQRMD